MGHWRGEIEVHYPRVKNETVKLEKLKVITENVE